MADMHYRHKGVVRTVQPVEEEGRPFSRSTIDRLPSLDDYDRQASYEGDKWHNRCKAQRQRRNRNRSTNLYRPD